MTIAAVAKDRSPAADLLLTARNVRHESRARHQGCIDDGTASDQTPPAMATEMDAESSAPLLNCSHRCGSNITAMRFPICSH